MARSLVGRVVLEGGLVFDEPLHIGGMAEEAGLDSLHVRDGLDRHVIPGTSLLGVISRWLRDVAPTYLPDVPVDDLFGGVDESSSGASRLRIYDVELVGMNTEVVDGVGIDRFTGTAADGIKFDRVVLRQTSGSVSRFAMECEIGGAINQHMAKQVIVTVASAMNAGILRLGAGTTRGLGGFRLVGVDGDGVPRSCTEILDRRGVLDRLTGTRRMEPIRNLPDVSGAGISISVSLASRTPTFVKSSLEGRLLDLLPRVVAKGGDAVLVIPGSSVKGVLRSEVERFLRSVRNLDVAPADSHHEQIRMPIVDTLFGNVNGSDSDLVSSGFKATVRFGDLIGRLATSKGSSLSWSQWSLVETAVMSDKSGNPDSDRKKVVEVLRSVGLDSWQPTDHVAIDRWTSGVTDSKLFSVLEPHGVMWEPLKIGVDVSRLEAVGVDPLVAVAAVLSAFQQLHSGAIGLGWGTHRGHGSVAVTALSIQGLADSGLFSLGSVDPRVDLMSQIEASDRRLMSSLRSAWSREVAS